MRLPALLAVLLALVLTLAWWASRGPESAERGFQPQAEASSETPVASELQGVGLEAIRRSQRAQETAGESIQEVDRPMARVLVRATDLDGVPAPGVRILMGPPLHALNAVGVTDREGECGLEWEPERWPAEIIVAARGRGDRLLFGLRRVQVGPKAPVNLHLAIEAKRLPDPLARGLRVDDAEAKRELRPWNQLPEDRTIETAIYWKHATAPRAPDGDGPPEEFYELDEEFDSEHWHKERPALLHSDRAALFASGSSIDELLEVEVMTDFEISDHNESDAPEYGEIRGRLVTTDGEPASQVRVVARGRSDHHPDLWWDQDVERTDADGRFLLSVLPGEVEVVAGWDLARTQLSVSLEQASTWNATVDRGLAFRAALRQEDGAPLVGAQIELSAEHAGDLWISVGVTDAEGGLRLDGAPAATVAVDLEPGAKTPGLVYGWGHYPIGAQGVFSPTDLPGTATLTFRPGQEDNWRLKPGELRLWGPDARRGRRLRLHDRDQPQSFQVAAGNYSASMGSKATLWSRATPLDLHGDQELEPLPYAPHAELVLPPFDAERTSVDSLRPLRLIQLRPNGPSLVLPWSHPPLGEELRLAVPAGSYRLERSNGAASTDLTLESAGSQSLDWYDD